MSHTVKAYPVTTPSEPAISPLAGKPAPKELLIDVARLEKEYFERKPDVSDPNQLVGVRNKRSSRLSFSRHIH